MTAQTALQQGRTLLQQASIPEPRLTAEILLSHALHRDRTYLFAHPEHELTTLEWIHYGRYLHERLKRKPTQYITRIQEFYGRPFAVTPDVLIPRQETEHLVEAALALARTANHVVDVGTGSGCIAITLSLEAARPVVATDISPGALAVARRNAAVLRADIVCVQTDRLSAFEASSIDLIVSNPPYVAEIERASLQPEVRDWEPPLALFAGASGLDFFCCLVPEAARVLRTGGHLVMELGAGQAREISSLFGPEWDTPHTFQDLAGIERILSARKP